MQPFSLSMVEGTGSLLVRDAAEPYQLTNPTTITGSHDTGVDGTGEVTGGAFSSPAISFQTVALGFDVFVDAAFSQVTPSSGTGVIDSDGNVVFQAELTVDLHIEVDDPPFIVADCRATPVSIKLESTTPYVPGEGDEPGTVTLRDADFSVPAVPVTPECESLVANNVNSLLSGSGHSLTMQMEGDLELPPPPGCPPSAELSVSPDGESRLGNEVTLSATVAFDPDTADDPLCEDAGSAVVPTGFVEFREGSRILGTAELDGTGTATFSTSSLPAGTFALSARYRGTPPYAGATSEPVTHRVAATPAITADLPDFFQIDGGSVEFDVTLTNTGLGSAVTNARLDLAFARSSFFAPDMISLEYMEGGVFVPAAFPIELGGFVTSIGDSTGTPLAPGQEVTYRVRLAFHDTPDFAVPPGPLSVRLAIVEVDPVTGAPALSLPAGWDTLADVELETFLVEETRRPSRIATEGVFPHTVRQGQTVELRSVDVQPATGDATTLPRTGSHRLYLDGRLVPVRIPQMLIEQGYLDELTIDPNSGFGSFLNPIFVVPPDAPTGTHEVTIKYSGDRIWTPAQWTTTITVLPSRGVDYQCRAAGIGASEFVFNVNVEAFANVPAVRSAGSEVALGQLDITLYADRGPAAAGLGQFFFLPVNPIADPPTLFAPLRSIDFGLAGGAGTGTATAMTISNNMPMFDFTRPVDPDPDQVVGFQSEVGSVVVEGAPGEVVPVTLDSIGFEALIFGALNYDFSCAPVGDAIVLGDVTVSGTTLSVDAPAPVREGDEVVLTASVFPTGTTGTVEFRSGEESVGVTQLGSDGVAVAIVDDLPPGLHSLTARSHTGLGATSTTSAPVELEVLVATECAAFAEEGNEAVVRLVYMELLGRCPDEVGFDFWVGRLDGGTSPEVFARTIARTPEAVGRVVDDAYRTMLGRSADASGRAFWTGRLLGHGRYDTLLADLGASEEFWSQSGSSNTGFVTRVYEQLLNRAPEQAGQDYWVGRLDAGTSRRALIISLSNQDEPLWVLVTDSYDEILSRTPSSSELSDGVMFLRSTGDRSGLYARLIGTAEFFDRAQGFPNPED